MGFGMAVAPAGPYQTWNWVIGSPGQWVILVIFHVRVTGSLGHHFHPMWDPIFSGFRKKAQDKDIYFCENPSNLIEILTFNKWSSKFCFPKACKRQTAIKTGKPLAHCKRLSATKVNIWSSLSSLSSGHWVAGSQNVTQLHVCNNLHLTSDR